MLGRTGEVSLPAPLVRFGQVDIVSGENLTTLMIDEQDTGHATDGVVEHAFRLQQAASLAFSGRAAVDERVGWVWDCGRSNSAGHRERRNVHPLRRCRTCFTSRTMRSTLRRYSSRPVFSLLGAARSAQLPVAVQVVMSVRPGSRRAELRVRRRQVADNRYACCNCPIGCGCCAKQAHASLDFHSPGNA